MSLTLPLPRLLPYLVLAALHHLFALINWAPFRASAFSRFKGLAEAPEPLGR